MRERGKGVRVELPAEMRLRRKLLCPGIRPEWSLKDDQKRVATPKVAITEGADYLVIGRAVTSATNRVEAMEKIYKEISEA